MHVEIDCWESESIETNLTVRLLREQERKMFNLSLASPSLLSQGIFDVMFNDMLDKNWDSASKKSTQGFPVTDVYQNSDGSSTVEVALAGYCRGDVEISVQPNKSTITIASKGIESEAGRSSGRVARRAFSRSFTDVHNELDLVKAEAKFENGLLTITIPKLAVIKPVSIVID